jgi:cell shape-determining protein MreD
MRYIIYTIAILVNFALTKDLFGQMTLGGAIPNLNLLLVIIVASESDRLDFLFIALVAGLVTDIGFGLPIGTFAFAYIFSGLLSHILFHGPLSLTVGWKNFALATLMGVILTYLWTIVFSKILAAAGILPFSFAFGQLWHIIFFTLVYNIILAFPLFWIYTAVTRYTNKFNRKSSHLA